MYLSAPLPEVQAPSILEDEQQHQVLTVYQGMEGLEALTEGSTLEVIVSEDLLSATTQPPPEKKHKKDAEPGKPKHNASNQIEIGYCYMYHHIHL